MNGVRRATRVVGISMLGGLVLVAGLVMLVTPGPGLLAVAAGLAILSREFAWARRLLDRVRIRLTRPRFRTRDHRAAVTDLGVGGPRPADLTGAVPRQRHVA